MTRTIELGLDWRVTTSVNRIAPTQGGLTIELPLIEGETVISGLLVDFQTIVHDKLIDKQLPGSFTGTDLDGWLQQNDVDTISISGYMTQMCCDTTARQAFHRGYKVEFLKDATGTLTVENEAGKATAEELHQSTLVAQQMFISEVISNTDWSARVGR